MGGGERQQESVADFDDRTPVSVETVRAAARETEISNELRRDITRFFSDLPSTLSVPAAFELARCSSQDIAHYEHMYRVLYERFRTILHSHVPSLGLPPFDAFLEDGPRGGNLHKASYQSLLRNGKFFLGNQLFPKVASYFALFAACAENIGSAKYLQKHPPEVL